jgi:hypothetical protein
VKSTKKLKLPAIEAENRQEGKYSLTLDPYLNLELQQYLDAYRAQYPDKKAPKADDLIVAIVRQHLAGDTDFTRYKKSLKKDNLGALSSATGQ